MALKPVIGVLLLGMFIPQISQATDASRKSLASDEQILWFPALATPTNGSWQVTLHGLITEEESRRTVSGLARRFLGFSEEELGPAERAVFRERTKWFLADDEGGKRMVVDIAGQRLDLGRTGGNGHFTGKLLLPGDALPATARSAALPCVVSANRRSVRNEVTLCAVPRRGISVVSDIDDTIKISDVLNRDELLRNTFLRPFRAVDGIAAHYQQWAKDSNARFHYVSGSPWQLFPALEEWAAAHDFPAGSWHLRSVRLTDRSVREFFKTPDTHKLSAIEELLSRLPERLFVLVGDSGERDPEIYGELARRHPQRILRIWIRDVTGEPASSPRYEKAFAKVPAKSWTLFKSADELPHALDL